MTAPTPTIGASGYSRRMSLKLQRLTELFSEDGSSHIESSAMKFIIALQMSNAQKSDDVIAEGQLQYFAHLLLFEAFHGGCVITQDLGHEHHGSEGDHDVAVEPHRKIRMIREVVRDIDFGLLGVVFRHAAFAPQTEHLFQVAITPTVGVAACRNHCGGLFDLSLIETCCAQTPLLLSGAHNDKTPRLHIVTAWSL